MKRLFAILILLAPLGCASLEKDRLISQLDALQDFMAKSGAAGTIDIVLDPSGHVSFGPSLQLRSASSLTAKIQFNAKGP